jgi:hypothetical protein
MSFLNHLLDSTSCNPDGSLGQNPLTALMEKSMEYFHQEESQGGNIPYQYSTSVQQQNFQEEYHLQQAPNFQDPYFANQVTCSMNNSY